MGNTSSDSRYNLRRHLRQIIVDLMAELSDIVNGSKHIYRSTQIKYLIILLPHNQKLKYNLYQLYLKEQIAFYILNRQFVLYNTFEMLKKALFKEIQENLKDHGFYRVETTTCRKMESDFCMEDAVKEFVDLQLSEQSQNYLLLYDFMIEQNSKILIGTASEAELFSGEIQIEDEVILRFELSDIKEMNLICLCRRDISLKAVLDEVRKGKRTKTRRYRNKIANTLIKERIQIVIDGNREEEPPRLAKKNGNNAIFDVLNRKMEIESHEENRRRRLLLCSEQSESDQFSFKDKLSSEIAIFSMKDVSKSKKSHHQHQVQREQGIQGTLNEVKQESLMKNSKESKASKAQSLNMEKQTSINNRKPSRPANFSKQMSKKQIAREQVSKQSNFMTNWIKKPS